MVLMENGSLMKVESIAECSPWSILQYFWPALSDNWYWKTKMFFFSGRLRQVLLYKHVFSIRVENSLDPLSEASWSGSTVFSQLD